MKILRLRGSALFIFFILVFNVIAVGSISQGITVSQDVDEQKLYINNESSDDFYFVHLTDTHLLNKIFDKNENSKNRLLYVLNHIQSFDEKPAFVVITGDLVEWGSGTFGAMNYMALMKCFYTENNQHYIDSNCSIPVYFTPGNHEYYFSWNLVNYHRFVDKDHIVENDRYEINYENMSLFFMDSGAHYMLEPKDWLDVYSRGLTNQDMRWLEEKLSSCVSKQKIVLMHYPAINYRDGNNEMNGVLLRNRERFIELCDEYNVDLVLTGHLHSSRVFDSEKNRYYNYPLNCSLYPTLHVQSDDCKESVNYRNITVVGNDTWLEQSMSVDFVPVEDTGVGSEFRSWLKQKLKDIFSDIQNKV
jgi:3',5'-cyclic AMP phosphodiesterase CpdA